MGRDATLAGRVDSTFVAGSHRGFSESNDVQQEEDDDEDGAKPISDSSRGDIVIDATGSQNRGLAGLDDDLTALGLDNHAQASDLDEQLAKLFLASSSGRNGSRTDLAELEAFLESEDPSWPATLPALSSQTNEAADDATAGATAPTSTTFDDDFGDDFLPFQSASTSASNPAPSLTTTAASLNDDDWLNADASQAADFPPMAEISEMQDRLFGSNAASRLEAGPLGMGSGGATSAGQDLASQLQQLSWHAQRVRNIDDPIRGGKRLHWWLWRSVCSGPTLTMRGRGRWDDVLAFWFHEFAMQILSNGR